jgi:hypothetical protein
MIRPLKRCFDKSSPMLQGLSCIHGRACVGTGGERVQ